MSDLQGNTTPQQLHKQSWFRSIHGDRCFLVSASQSVPVILYPQSEVNWVAPCSLLVSSWEGPSVCLCDSCCVYRLGQWLLMATLSQEQYGHQPRPIQGSTAGGAGWVTSLTLCSPSSLSVFTQASKTSAVATGGNHGHLCVSAEWFSGGTVVPKILLFSSGSAEYSFCCNMHSHLEILHRVVVKNNTWQGSATNPLTESIQLTRNNQKPWRLRTWNAILKAVIVYLPMDEDNRAKETPRSSLPVHMEHSQDLQEANPSG